MSEACGILIKAILQQIRDLLSVRDKLSVPGNHIFKLHQHFPGAVELKESGRC